MTHPGMAIPKDTPFPDAKAFLDTSTTKNVSRSSARKVVEKDTELYKGLTKLFQNETIISHFGWGGATIEYFFHNPHESVVDDFVVQRTYYALIRPKAKKYICGANDVHYTHCDSLLWLRMVEGSKVIQSACIHRMPPRCVPKPPQPKRARRKPESELWPVKRDVVRPQLGEWFTLRHPSGQMLQVKFISAPKIRPSR